MRAANVFSSRSEVPCGSGRGCAAAPNEHRWYFVDQFTVRHALLLGFRVGPSRRLGSRKSVITLPIQRITSRYYHPRQPIKESNGKADSGFMLRKTLRKELVCWADPVPRGAIADAKLSKPVTPLHCATMATVPERGEWRF